MAGNIILGGGITGLAAGIKTGYPIYEGEYKPGGICRSYMIGRYHFCIGGGHWIFGVDSTMKDYLSQFCTPEKYERRADVYIATEDKFYPYPIQVTVRANTFKEWLEKSYSADLCNKFFLPFNDRYTGGLYDKISPQDLYKSGASSGYNPVYYYPHEGLAYMVDRMGERCDIKYNKKATDIDIEGRIVSFSDGTRVSYDTLFSSLPLNIMTKFAGFEGKEDPYSSVDVLNIGAKKGKRCPSSHWTYVPDAKSGFHRVQFYSNVNSSHAPDGKVSLCIESADTIVREAAIKELQDWGWIEQVDVIDNSPVKVAYTWMWPESTWREDAIAYLEKHNIIQMGRYARWHFQGIAESIKEGLTIA